MRKVGSQERWRARWRRGRAKSLILVSLRIAHTFRLWSYRVADDSMQMMRRMMMTGDCRYRNAGRLLK